MNYQYTSAGSQNMDKRRKRVHDSSCEELQHVRKVRQERLYWRETGRGNAPQERILVNQGEVIHHGPMRGGMDWWPAPPDLPKYTNMAPQMSSRQPQSIYNMHSYNQYAPCHLNHPPTSRIALQQPVNCFFFFFNYLFIFVIHQSVIPDKS